MACKDWCKEMEKDKTFSDAIISVMNSAVDSERERCTERCARICEELIVDGGVWDHDRAVAAYAFRTAAKLIRSKGGV